MVSDFSRSMSRMILRVKKTGIYEEELVPNVTVHEYSDHVLA